MDIVKVFASNVRKLRMQAGVSQEALAERSGLHRTYISAVERGKRSISLRNIQKIAEALNTQPSLLLIDHHEQ